MNVSEYLERRALSVLGLLPALDPTAEEKMTFVNDFEEIVKQRIETYVTWYSGDSDELLRIYNYNARVEYRTEYYYYLNDRAYYWSVSSMEKDFKRTHSGFAKAMVDVIVDICGTPLCYIPSLPSGEEETVSVAGGEVDASSVLESVLEENDFWSLYQNEQMPMTLVEGWGAYKIHWDKKVYGNFPVISYYRANSCRIYRRGNRCLGITFLSWYKDGKGERYLIAETRAWKVYGVSATFITEVFKSVGDDLLYLSEGDCDGLPSKPEIKEDMPLLFAEPCSFYADQLHEYAGNSVLAGKIDLLDDLDQALSIASNTVRRATPIETFDLDFCERGKDGVPKLPNTFERKYVGVRGQKNMNGESLSSKPVEVTQPALNTQMFDEHINTIQRMIINGILSPAVMGLDIGLKDTNDTLRQKDRTTVHTRNHILAKEKRILSSLLSQALVAKEYLDNGAASRTKWKVEVAFDEFSDVSYESKIQTMSAVLANDGISPEMYVNKVYGNSLTTEEKDKEVEWISNAHQAQQGQNGQDGMPFEDDGGGEMADLLGEGEAKEPSGKRKPQVPKKGE